jgi:hypothetical protein
MRITIVSLMFLFGLGYTFPASDSIIAGKENSVLESLVAFGWQMQKDSKEDPIKTVSKKVENPHVSGQIDEWRTKTYSGKSIKVYWISTTNEELLQQVRIWGKKMALPLGIRIGDDEKKIIQKIGEPLKRDGDSFTYFIRESPTQDPVTLKFTKGRLKEVVWDYYLD